MRKIIAFLMASTDGYYEGPDRAFDWPVVDGDFNEFAAAQLDEADTLLFGRATYTDMAAYWPGADATQDDSGVATRMNGTPKVVVSRTLTTADWPVTTIISGDGQTGLAALKQQPGRGILLLGSSALAASLLPSGLIDELRIMMSPIVLGGGKSLLHTAEKRASLELLSARPFRSGNVLLTYRPLPG
jgi:dihydrofolate reductase